MTLSTQELEFHLEGALVNGVTAEEVRELLLQAVFYCGLPAVSEGFRVAHGVVASPPSDASA
ncbi:carboxymuconolactone decarboxylase family protein [Streptomyces sp. NPDC002018]|uniref:carboxymuconolactone decarboxylase family protein n=1 Tax=Streptomyces sp. NPDC002018 TaxID=3364629 RepID=UPI0036A09730